MRPHDLLVLLKIISLKDDWLNKDLSSQLYISSSEISESLNRSMIAKLISPDKRKVFKNALYKFINYGLSYVFPAVPGPVVRGMPTAHSAPILNKDFLSNEPYVWPSLNGSARGQAITPLHPKQVLAAQDDETLYIMLALVDAIRVGRVREAEKALEILKIYFDLDHA